MVDLKCPTGMVIQKPEGAVHPDEPTFCMKKTEVPQENDNRFWAARSRKEFELFIKLVGGGTRTVTNLQKAPLQKEAEKQIKDKKVASVEIRSVIVGAKPQPEGKMAGPRKPAVLRTWQEAREYCQGTYPGGDLPTERQWENACGDKTYCTASGNLNHREAIYDARGSADVGSTPANPRGVQDMTGTVWEWMRDDTVDGYKRIRGGSWSSYGDIVGLRAVNRGYGRPGDRGVVGFRCVAPPLSPSTQSAKGKVEAPPKASKKVK